MVLNRWYDKDEVTLHAGVWIETIECQTYLAKKWSLPMRECGLKLIIVVEEVGDCGVTPHAGVWIETSNKGFSSSSDLVTPHAGVWIETPFLQSRLIISHCHSPCGSVD